MYLSSRFAEFSATKIGNYQLVLLFNDAIEEIRVFSEDHDYIQSDPSISILRDTLLIRKALQNDSESG